MNRLIKSALILLLLAILIEFLILKSPEDPRRQDISPQEKIKSVKGNILDDEGKLIYSGFLTKPGIQWDFDALKSKWNKRYRFKEWEFYAIHHENVTISFGIANFHYVASVFFTVYEKGSIPQYHQKLILPNEELTLAKHPLNGKTIYESGNYKVDFKNRDNKFKHLELKFDDKLELSLDVFKKTDDSMASLTPFNSDGSNFYYTYKDYNNYISGKVTAFGKVYDFSDRIGMIDWGRGVWPYHSFWIWGSGQGKIGPNSAIGLNIGEFMFSPISKATEDCVFLDRTMYKLGNFITSYPKDLSQPWEFKTTNQHPTDEYGSASIIFYPEIKSIFASNFWLIQSHFDQAFGVFEGNITTRDGEISFKARGLVEVHHTRW
ncbi:unnamed protein product [Blepharisma stoltei]|uniref:DUF2804 domain-containing protein n=1 Tax=Blepharisma stoltei TaxID=1481888 RepID=A0AAU9JJ35_9CILI|nr:unnamed protein product [Blepharisma stoltei]